MTELKVNDMNVCLPSSPATQDQSAVDIHWMRAAIEQASEAYDRGDWPTGAVLVKDGQWLSAGQNRQNTQGDVTAHAETDAVQSAYRAHGPSATVGSTLYCTMEPCPMCAGALKLAGVRTVVLALRHATLRRTDLGRYSLEDFCDMTGFDIELRDGVLESDYLALRLRWGGDQVALKT
ncbi:nucleoside deaminase [Variovorax sp. OV700]|uniref:nucleoside deaminase n=1 Tax=Variovorax sp. OV700 TaxID=1882826 RepID=UPI0015872B31|nr:nucleoside deaminase [Variovorax sp. OV700]